MSKYHTNQDDTYNKKVEIIHHIQRLLDRQKLEIEEFYSQFKIKLPVCIKNATIGQLKQAGAQVHVEPVLHIILPAHILSNSLQVEETSKRRIEMLKKLTSLEKQLKQAAEDHYNKIKTDLPESIKKTTLGELGEHNSSISLRPLILRLRLEE